LRQTYPAAIARLKTLVDRYPLYSGADEALFLLGRTYEGEIEMVRKNPRAAEVVKGKMIEELTREAASAYGRIITRYPAMDRAVDAKARLEALHQPVPRPTRKALEENKKEVASRQQAGLMSSMMGGLGKRPDTSHAAHTGEPTMVDKDPVTATGVVRDLAQAAGAGGASADGKLSATVVNASVAPNQEPPRSDAATVSADTTAPAGQDQAPATGPAPDAATANELKPNVGDANELKPNVEPDPNALPPLQQSNQLANTSGTSGGQSGNPSARSSQKNEDLADISSSKKKKKKGLGKLNPF